MWLEYWIPLTKPPHSTPTCVTPKNCSYNIWTMYHLTRIFTWVKLKNPSMAMKYTYLSSLMLHTATINWNIASKSLVIPHCYCLVSYRDAMDVCIPDSLLHFIFEISGIGSTVHHPGARLQSSQVTWMLVNILILMVTLKQKPISDHEGPTCMNNFALEPVLFEKLHNIKLSCSVFRVATFFQFESTKAALEILLHYVHDFKENLKTLWSWS